MKVSGLPRQFLLLFLSIVFSIALMFAFTELPRLLDTAMGGFPDLDHGRDELNAFKAEVYISALNLRWIGYTSLGLVLGFIILGFVTKRSGWALAGAFTIFLPVFGNFALSMFFLAGLGILRVGWMPFMDISFQVLDLGNVIYIPYWVVMWFFRQLNYWAQSEIAWVFMASGALLFTWGVLVWMQSRFSNKGVATSWIYRISRHPQYLGWIIWTYGLIIYAPLINQMKKTWNVASSLPWLLMTMIIIGICMLEEIKMRKQYGDQYNRYRDKTPFLFPLPGWFKKIIKLPMWLLIRKQRPERKKEVALVISVYTIILIGISLFWVDTGSTRIFPVSEENRREIIEELVYDLQQPMYWRDRNKKFEDLLEFGNIATPYIIELLGDDIPENQENAAKLVGHTGDISAIHPLLKLLSHPWENVRVSAIYSLVALEAPGLEKVLHKQLEIEEDGYPKSVIYKSLAEINAENSWEIIQAGTSLPDAWASLSAVKAMASLYPDSAAVFLNPLLIHEQKWIRTDAVALAIIVRDEKNLPYLRTLLNDEVYEIRFFAEQAIERIEEKAVTEK